MEISSLELVKSICDIKEDSMKISAKLAATEARYKQSKATLAAETHRANTLSAEVKLLKEKNQILHAKYAESKNRLLMEKQEKEDMAKSAESIKRDAELSSFECFSSILSNQTTHLLRMIQGNEFMENKGHQV